MKVYLAADYRRREELCLYKSELEADGVEVTSRWLLGEDQSPVGGWGLGGLENAASAFGDPLTDHVRSDLSRRDLDDIALADVLVQFTTGELSRGGRQVELGAALAWEMPVVVCGPPEHMFHSAPGVYRYRSWEAVKLALKTLQGVYGWPTP